MYFGSKIRKIGKSVFFFVKILAEDGAGCLYWVNWGRGVYMSFSFCCFTLASEANSLKPLGLRSKNDHAYDGVLLMVVVLRVTCLC